MSLPFHENASWKMFEYARSLKKVMTPAENLLWQNLRNRKVCNCKFRRQHPISTYIVDFYCHEAKLVIEVDGGIHLTPDNIQYDQFRTEELEEMGLKVIRFTNDEVLGDVSRVLVEITLPSPLAPLPGGEGDNSPLQDLAVPFSHREKG